MFSLSAYEESNREILNETTDTVKTLKQQWNDRYIIVQRNINVKERCRTENEKRFGNGDARFL